jgi:hypothetical protein
VIASAPLIGALLADASWQLAFFDGTAAVFVRRAARAAAAPPLDLERELRAAIRNANDYTCQADQMSLVPLWWEIVGMRRRQDLARVFRARARFYLLAGREDLAGVARQFAFDLEGAGR